MWFFWGNEGQLVKPFKVKGISGETGEEIILFERELGNTLNPHFGADQHIPSSLKIPQSGFWKIEAYFDNELFGSLIVNVRD